MSRFDVIEQRLIGAAAAYALLLAVIICIFAALAVAAWVGRLTRYWQARRVLRRPPLGVRVVAARALTATAPVVETEPGINLADLDACELMLSDPEFAAHCDRLWQAIRDEQHKGDQK